MLHRLRSALAALCLIAVAAPAMAAQGTLCAPTTGSLSGLGAVTAFNSALSALVTSNSGASAPANDCGGVAVKGQLWLDTSATPNLWKLYDGSSWLTVGVSDGTNHVWTPPVGGGVATIASATTTDLGSVPQAYVSVTGTTTITGLGSSAVAGTAKFVKFAGVLTLTYHATNLILPSAASITTQAGDQALFVYLGSGHWSALAYTRADGTSLVSASAFSSAIAITGVISPTALTTSTNDWAPTGLSTAAVIRASGTIDLSITGLAAQPTGTVLFLQNVGTTILTLPDASGSSTAANTFAFGGVDIILGAKHAIILRYDGTLSRWTAVADFRKPATQAQAEAGTDNATAMTPLRTKQAITAATGTSAGKIVALDGSAKLPAVDGSQLTGITAGGWTQLVAPTSASGLTQDFTSLPSGYQQFALRLTGVARNGSGGGMKLALSSNNGSSFGTLFTILGTSGVNAPTWGVVYIDGVSITGGKTIIPATKADGSAYNTPAVDSATTGTINALRVSADGASFNAGVFSIFGIK